MRKVYNFTEKETRALRSYIVYSSSQVVGLPLQLSDPKPEPSLWASQMDEGRGYSLGNFELQDCFQKDLVRQKLLTSYMFLSGLAQNLGQLSFQVKGLTWYLR